MARLVAQHMTPGTPAKPDYLSPLAAQEWDRLTAELEASGVQVSKAHRALIEQAAVISADMTDAQEVIKIEGAYVSNVKTGALQSHPALRRLDALRRDLIKVLSMLGLRQAVSGGSGEESLKDLLGA